MAECRPGLKVTGGDLLEMSEDVLRRLSATLKQRKTAEAGSSYVASLYHKGLNKILEKIGEEATETIIAAKDADANKADLEARNEVIKETADLWFHSLVMLSHMDIETDELLAELENRMGTSGHAEKAARTASD